MATNKTLADIRFDAGNGNHVAVSSAVSSGEKFIGLALNSEDVAVHPITANQHEVARRCRSFGDRFLIVSGSSKLLTKVVSEFETCSRDDEWNQALNVLTGSGLRASEYGFEAEAAMSPDVGRYPVNITTEGKLLWDKLVSGDLYRRNTSGRSMKYRWAIAMKMYMDKASRSRVKPFVASTRDNSKSELTKAYNNTLSMAGSLEEQLRDVLVSRDYLKPKRTRWVFKEVSYNAGKFVCVISTRWEANTDVKRIIRHLVRNENFVKNSNGAGWIFPVSGNATLRVRARVGRGELEIDMFVLFSRTRLVDALRLDGTKKIKDLLDDFHSVAKHWFERKRF